MVEFEAEEVQFILDVVSDGEPGSPEGQGCCGQKNQLGSRI